MTADLLQGPTRVFKCHGPTGGSDLVKGYSASDAAAKFARGYKKLPARGLIVWACEMRGDVQWDYSEQFLFKRS